MSDNTLTKENQFYAEIAALRAEIDRLRANLAQRTAEVAKANAERDEARREVCNLSGGFDVKQSRRVADARGWNCFDAKEGES